MAVLHPPLVSICSFGNQPTAGACRIMDAGTYMCKTPSYIPEYGMVGCRHCWQCKENRINDIVGRCIAESRVSDATYAVTLTYAGDDPNSVVLQYIDVRRFLARLRKAGYNVRFIVAGEFGSAKGRAHWHIVLFFKGKVPHVEERPERGSDAIAIARYKDDPRGRINWKYWPHGFCYFQVPDYTGIRYVIKYMAKDEDKETGYFSCSRYPPLGYDFFMNELVEKYVKFDLAPQNPTYSFQDVRRKEDRKPRQFWLQGAMKDHFVRRFIERYREVYGTDPPYSDFVEEWEDKQIAATGWRDLQRVEDMRAKAAETPVLENVTHEPNGSYSFAYLGYSLTEGRPIWIGRHENGTFDCGEGLTQWLEKASETELRKLLSERGVKPLPQRLFAPLPSQ
ncbi:replication initiation protein [Tortoise microvirus 81]|nr:replication initiation protein [Tortoise microvirus 81]